MTDTTPAAIEALMKDVTPGPWAVWPNLVITAPDPDCPGNPWNVARVTENCGWPDQTEANARFIAAARDLVPALAADRDYWKARAEATSTARTDTIMSDPRVVALVEAALERPDVMAVMVDAAETAYSQGVSFNVVIGRARRAAIAALKGASHD